MEYLKDDKFAAAHGFFGRKGGVSAGIFESLNCGLGTADDPEAVAENRRRAVTAFAGSDIPLLTPRQDHTDICLIVTEPWRERPVADALATDAPGLAIGILTADCAPVLFAGRRTDGARVVGAAHAGWKGALNGILENTVAAMQKLGAQEITAALGPCINPESYEVGPEFRELFGPEFFRGGNFDLPAYVRHRLERSGVELLSFCAADTYAGDYFSYRRSVHRKEPDYGRQLSVITILL